MPYLGIAKQRLADRLGSAATKGEGRQNMLCAYLAGALLVGLLGNALFGAWWLDPAVGLLIAAVAVEEGVEAWRGEGCACMSDPLASAEPPSAATTAATMSGRDRRRYWSSAACTARSNAPLPNEPSRRAATLPSRVEGEQPRLGAQPEGAQLLSQALLDRVVLVDLLVDEVHLARRTRSGTGRRCR